MVLRVLSLYLVGFYLLRVRFFVAINISIQTCYSHGMRLEVGTSAFSIVQHVKNKRAETSTWCMFFFSVFQII